MTMGKKIILVILAIFLANIIGTSLLISTVNSIQAPEVTIDITISKITEDTITIEARLSIDNPNSFPIILENMLINASSPKGDNIALISLPNAIVG
jgi:LEA14-like dessication related protein